MTLRARIHLLVVLAVAPAFALLFYNHHQSLAQRETDAEQQALRNTWAVAAELDQVFEGVENLLRAAAQTPMVAELEAPACGQYIARLQQISAAATWIVALDGHGAVRCGNGDTAGLAAAGDLVRAALERDGLVVGTYLPPASGGGAVLPVALRLRSDQQSGVLVAGIGLDWMREHFAGRFDQMPPDSSLTIADRGGTILLRLPNAGREGKPLGRYSFVLTAAAPGTFRSIAENNADGIARFLGYLPLDHGPQGVAIAVGHPQQAVLAAARASAVWSYLLLGLVAALAFLAAALGGRIFIRRPVAELLATIERWRNQDLSARVTRTDGPSEFAELGIAFNAMADRLQDALHHKDVLLRELSHRIMNSLQTISGLFRLQSRTVQPPEAAAQFEQAIRRIDAIALAYKRMETAGGVESVEFASFMAALCRDLEASLMSTPCVVRAEPLHLSARQAIPLSLILNELVTNAVKHGSGEAQPIVVELKNGEELCRLAVESAGQLPEERPTAAGGFGMKMVSTMVEQLHGKLEVSSQNGRTEFAVTFRPAALDATV